MEKRNAPLKSLMRTSGYDLDMRKLLWGLYRENYAWVTRILAVVVMAAVEVQLNGLVVLGISVMIVVAEEGVCAC